MSVRIAANDDRMANLSERTRAAMIGAMQGLPALSTQGGHRSASADAKLEVHV